MSSVYLTIAIIFLLLTTIQGSFPHKYNKAFYVEQYNRTELQNTYGGDLHRALKDIITGMPANQLTLAFDHSIEYKFVNVVLQYFSYFDLTVQIYNITEVNGQKQYISYMLDVYKNYHDATTLFFCNHKMAEHLLMDIYENNLIRRNLVYMFYWGKATMYRYFLRSMHENMRIVVITNPRIDAYRIYYNQASSHRQHHLDMVNWWIDSRGLFQHPTLPSAKKIFKDFKGKIIYIPVIHKPPWHFVRFDNNETIQVLGGRDDGIIRLLSQRLNFRFEYFDPPERIQGTSLSPNGTFEGVIGQLWRREAEFFIGDVALTIDRANVVEFSFFTLADSGAFITHSPSKLNEAFALVRPFHWRVWPAIVVTVVLSGPVLYFLISLPNLWQPRFKIRNQKRYMFDISWYTAGIFLKQAGNSPSNSHKARFIIIVLSICATYVIGDMYAANLTAMLANPGREKPITNLAQLAEAMDLKGYKLVVESHSSSFSLVENGTGIYGALWEMMTKRQKSYLVESVEQGVKMVRDSSDTALMAGRETLFFDIQRFGASKFHLSIKLNTAYSAIALQIGCPYLENFNRILMGIFEAGILTKMTEDEYVNLGRKKGLVPDNSIGDGKETPKGIDGQPQSIKITKAEEDDAQLQPISIKMLQGAFYLLGIGYIIAGFIVFLEIIYHRHDRHYKITKKNKFAIVIKVKNALLFYVKRMKFYVYRRVRLMMNEAIVSTLEYVE